jgi:hypothetical protein
MRHLSTVVLWCTVALPAFAIEPRPTVEIGPLGPLGRHVAAEFRQHSSSFRLSDGTAPPDYRVALEPRFRSETAQRLYRHNTGRSDDTILFFTCLETGRDLVRFDFQMGSSDSDHVRTAREFVQRAVKRLQKAD